MGNCNEKKPVKLILISHFFSTINGINRPSPNLLVLSSVYSSPSNLVYIHASSNYFSVAVFFYGGFHVHTDLSPSLHFSLPPCIPPSLSLFPPTPSVCDIDMFAYTRVFVWGWHMCMGVYMHRCESECGGLRPSSNALHLIH